MSPYPVIERAVESRLLAGVRARVPIGRVAQYFGASLDQVYAQRDTLPLDGQNVFVYSPCMDGHLTVDFCVGVTAAFDPVGNVKRYATPSGVAATTTHWGDYAGLRGAHDAVQAWLRAHGHGEPRVSWEVYGHWVEDARKLRTDIYYLLAPRPTG